MFVKGEHIKIEKVSCPAYQRAVKGIIYMPADTLYVNAILVKSEKIAPQIQADYPNLDKYGYLSVFKENDSAGVLIENYFKPLDDVPFENQKVKFKEELNGSNLIYILRKTEKIEVNLKIYVFYTRMK